MKSLIITMTALGVGAAFVAQANGADYKKDLEFSCDVAGADRDGYDVKVENKGVRQWACDVDVETTPSTGLHVYRKRPVMGRSGKQNLGGEARLPKNLQCRIKKVVCR